MKVYWTIDSGGEFCVYTGFASKEEEDLIVLQHVIAFLRDLHAEDPHYKPGHHLRIEV